MLKKWIIPLFFPPFIDFLIIPVFLILYFGSQKIVDADLFMHLQTGMNLLQKGLVLWQEPYSYTQTNPFWVNHHWLAQIFFYLLHKLGGMAALAAIPALCAVLILKLQYQRLLALKINLFLNIFLCGLSFLAIQAYFSIDPVVLSLVFFTLEIWILEKFRTPKKTTLLVLVLIMLVWANVHRSYLLGLFFGVAVYGMEWFKIRFAWPGRKLSREKWKHFSLYMLMFVLVSFINPYSFEGLHFAFQYLSSTLPPVKYVADWKNFYLFYQSFFIVYVFVFGLALALSKREKDLSELLPGLLLLLATLVSPLYLPFFVIASLSLTAQHLQQGVSDFSDRVLNHGPRGLNQVHQAFRDWIFKVSGKYLSINAQLNPLITLGLVISIAVILPQIPQSRWQYQPDSKVFPVQMATFLEQYDYAHWGRGLTDYRWAPYLVWKLPQTKIFIDNRAGVYSRQVLLEYREMVHVLPRFQEFLDQYQIRWALLPHEMPLHQALKLSSEWYVVRSDSTATLFRR